MPVPGTLKKRPFDPHQIARQLLAQFGLPEKEALAYLKLVETGGLSHEELLTALGVPHEELSVLEKSMLERGLVIESTGKPKTLVPLHPRMMLTNLFKIYEKDVVTGLRERRATVDRVVNLLIPVYEEMESKKRS